MEDTNLTEPVVAEETNILKKIYKRGRKSKKQRKLEKEQKNLEHKKEAEIIESQKNSEKKLHEELKEKLKEKHEELEQEDKSKFSINVFKRNRKSKKEIVRKSLEEVTKPVVEKVEEVVEKVEEKVEEIVEKVEEIIDVLPSKVDSINILESLFETTEIKDKVIDSELEIIEEKKIIPKSVVNEKIIIPTKIYKYYFDIDKIEKKPVEVHFHKDGETSPALTLKVYYDSKIKSKRKIEFVKNSKEVIFNFNTKIRPRNNKVVLLIQFRTNKTFFATIEGLKLTPNFKGPTATLNRITWDFEGLSIV